MRSIAGYNHSRVIVIKLSSVDGNSECHAINGHFQIMPQCLLPLSCMSCRRSLFSLAYFAS